MMLIPTMKVYLTMCWALGLHGLTTIDPGDSNTRE